MRTHSSNARPWLAVAACAGLRRFDLVRINIQSPNLVEVLGSSPPQFGRTRPNVLHLGCPKTATSRTVAVCHDSANILRHFVWGNCAAHRGRTSSTSSLHLPDIPGIERGGVVLGETSLVPTWQPAASREHLEASMRLDTRISAPKLHLCSGCGSR